MRWLACVVLAIAVAAIAAPAEAKRKKRKAKRQTERSIAAPLAVGTVIILQDGRRCRVVDPVKQICIPLD